MIKFGKTYRDVVTDFVGVATGQCQYITGCSQVLLAPKVDSAGNRREPQWFDVDRCQELDVPVVELTISTTSGPDIPAPIR